MDGSQAGERRGPLKEQVGVETGISAISSIGYRSSAWVKAIEVIKERDRVECKTKVGIAKKK
jgi:hypothetical protein